MNKEITVHTSRTIMFSELTKMMWYGVNQNSFENAFSDNVAGKLSKSSQQKTNRYLKQLYGFDMSDSYFASFFWYWKNADETDRPLIALLYAIRNDFHLAESIEVLNSTPVGEKVIIEELEKNITHRHQDRYSPATLRSLAQNIASSWKQAGFILGKVKNIRVEPDISFWVVSFALLLGYIEGKRGDFLLGSKYVKSLNLPDSKIRSLITEAAKRDILQYQHSGNVTTIIFSNLLKKIGIDGE